MTVIAAIAMESEPGYESFFMIGDLLVSRIAPPAPNEQISIPSRGAIPVGTGGRPDRAFDSLCQKVLLPTEHISVAWAGRQDKAIRVAEKLFSSVSATTSPEDVRKLIDQEMESVRLGELSCICAVIDQTSRMTSLFFWNAEEHMTAFGRVIVAGTGKDHFLKMIQSRTEWELPGRPASALEQRNQLRNLAPVVSLYVGLLSEEFRSLESLKSFYGGALEIVHRLGDRFEKFEDFSILIVQALQRNKAQVEFFDRALLLQSSYKDDYMVIHRLEIDVTNPTAWEVKDSKIFVVPPPWLSLSAEVARDLAEMARIATKFAYVLGHGRQIDGTWNSAIVFEANSDRIAPPPVGDARRLVGFHWSLLVDLLDRLFPNWERVPDDA